MKPHAMLGNAHPKDLLCAALSAGHPPAAASAASIACAAPDVRPRQVTCTLYSVTFLETLGGTISGATGINNRGQTVGNSFTEGNETSFATLWNGAEVTNLGALPGGDSSAATAINNAGLVVGNTSFPSAFFRPTSWTDGRPTDLGTLADSTGNALAVNNAGLIVGFSTVANNFARATLWDHGDMIDLGTLGGSFSIARGINEAGDIVGNSSPDPSDTVQHATLWSNGAVIDLGTLGGSLSDAMAINNQGQVVGWSFTSGDSELHAVLWEGGTATDLGTLGASFSLAHAINNRGQIVGTSSTADQAGHAFIWDDGVMTDLNTVLDASAEGVIIETAFAINDAGLIAGVAAATATSPGGAVLLTPTQGPCP